MSYLEGTVLFGGEGFSVVLVAGIGYKVFTVGFDATIGTDISLFLYDHIREDRHELFGFQDQDALALFESMIDINGVGPKLAQKILHAGNPAQLRKHILLGDVEYLTQLPGLGKKTAQKIVLEMKGVLVEDDVPQEGDADALEALIGLGYERKDVLAVLNRVEGETTEDRLRAALKALSR